MSTSTAALSEMDLGYEDRARKARVHGPADLEDWESDLWWRAEKRLGEFSLLREDWDGAGAEAPSFDAMTTAAAFLRRLYSEGAIPPTALSPTPLGAIVLEWRLDATYLEAEISGPDLLGWMKKSSDGSVEVW